MNVYRIILQVPKAYIVGSVECSIRDLYAVASSLDEAMDLYRDKWGKTPIKSIEQLNTNSGTGPELLHRLQPNGQK